MTRVIKEKMKSLIVSPSGVRGIVGKDLVPEVVVKFARAFGELMNGGKIAIGSDTRTSNEMFRYAAFSGLLSLGCEVVDLGICPTPSIQLMVKQLRARGGIVITGSHNPVEWNALKFVRSDGLFLYPEEGKKLLEIYESSIPQVGWDGLGTIFKDGSAIDNHLGKILEVVDREKIRKKKFKVVLDACNGAGALISPLLLSELGCEVTKVNCTPNGIFSHPPEPIPSNLGELCRIVNDEEADIGFAHDADADRLTVVSERGKALPEDYTLLLATRFVLKKSKGLVVTNVCTTHALDEIAREFGCEVIRTKVGDIWVSSLMKEKGAVIGGEGNGGVIIPQINYARDGIAAIALLLEYLAQENKPMSQLVDTLPQYFMVKKKLRVSLTCFAQVERELKEEFEKEKLNFLDGVKVEKKGGWVHIRVSGTEPVIRIIAEAKSKLEAENFAQWAIKRIERVVR